MRLSISDKLSIYYRPTNYSGSILVINKVKVPWLTSRVYSIYSPIDLYNFYRDLWEQFSSYKISPLQTSYLLRKVTKKSSSSLVCFTLESVNAQLLISLIGFLIHEYHERDLSSQLLNYLVCIPIFRKIIKIHLNKTSIAPVSHSRYRTPNYLNNLPSDICSIINSYIIGSDFNDKQRPHFLSLLKRKCGNYYLEDLVLACLDKIIQWFGLNRITLTIFLTLYIMYVYLKHN